MKVPVGPGCDECVSINQEQFPFLTWEEFCAASRKPAEEPGQRIAEVRALKKSGSSVKFKQCEVHVENLVGLRSQTEVICFTYAGYVKYFGCKPSVSKKAMAISVPRDEGTGDEKMGIQVQRRRPDTS